MCVHFSFLSADGRFPLNISKFQVERDHNFLDQIELDSLIRYPPILPPLHVGWVLLHMHASLLIFLPRVHSCVYLYLSLPSFRFLGD